MGVIGSVNICYHSFSLLEESEILDKKEPVLSASLVSEIDDPSRSTHINDSESVEEKGVEGQDFCDEDNNLKNEQVGISNEVEVEGNLDRNFDLPVLKKLSQREVME